MVVSARVASKEGSKQGLQKPLQKDTRPQLSRAGLGLSPRLVNDALGGALAQRDGCLRARGIEGKV